MNTRLQVEHPVTEEITGLDLVEWQLRVAAGETLPLGQDKIAMSGHAIEVRLCAEDPAKGFMPSVGRILQFDHAGIRSTGCRLETGVEGGSSVSPFYDSMIAKLICRGDDRQQAIAKSVTALERCHVFGVQTNAAFLYRLLRHPSVASGQMDTGLIARDLAQLTDAGRDEAAIRLGVERLLGLGAVSSGAGFDPWQTHDAFQLGPKRLQQINVMVDGGRLTVTVEWDKASGPVISIDRETPLVGSQIDARTGVLVDGPVVRIVHGLRETVIAWPTYDINEIADGSSLDVIRAPINGRLARIFVAEGDSVAKGDKIAVVEAMKMEHVLMAARDGRIAKVASTEGAQVTQGMLIATLEEARA